MHVTLEALLRCIFITPAFQEGSHAPEKTFVLSGDGDNDMCPVKKRRNIRCKGITTSTTDRQGTCNIYQKRRH